MRVRIIRLIVKKLNNKSEWMVKWWYVNDEQIWWDNDTMK